MKSFFGIEHLRLKGKRSGGGYVVNGLLPYVSNLGDDHYFGAIFEVDDGGRKAHRHGDRAMRRRGTDPIRQHQVCCARRHPHFFGADARVVIPDAWIIADPAQDYVKRIRAGFVLLQAGMAFGLIRDCIKLIERTKSPLGHVNKYLEVQPELSPSSLQPWKLTLRGSPQRRSRPIPTIGEP